VVNLAVELNGQPPVQVYIRPTTEPEIVIHSIDLGVSERLRTYGDLDGVSGVGSAFAIPRAALKLAGFFPGFSRYSYKTLEEQLRAFGGGLDISMMIAVPKGSGLGTSSIVAGALLGGLSECCSLGWDRQEVCYRVLLLEQMLTTGGGWQDQMGGIYEGIKLLESAPGLVQRPAVSWAPDHLFTRPDTKGMILLYYTGITRIAKTILADIVRGMFLNSSRHLTILEEMKLHAAGTLETVRRLDWNGLNSAVRYSWELNRRLDSGTNPPEVASIIAKISD
jgi:galactokinase/mevalonate kinase-like predicted kinase